MWAIPTSKNENKNNIFEETEINLRALQLYS